MSAINVYFKDPEAEPNQRIVKSWKTKPVEKYRFYAALKEY